MYSYVLYCIVFLCIVLYCTLMYCIVLYSYVLYCIVSSKILRIWQCVITSSLRAIHLYRSLDNKKTYFILPILHTKNYFYYQRAMSCELCEEPFNITVFQHYNAYDKSSSKQKVPMVKSYMNNHGFHT